MKYVSIIGSTGSIGTQTLDIVRAHPQDLKVCALAAGSKNLELLCKQIQDFGPDLVAVPDEDSRQSLLDFIKQAKISNCSVVIGEEGLISVAAHSQATVVVTAVVGLFRR